MKTPRIWSGDTNRKDCQIASIILLVVIWLCVGYQLWSTIAGHRSFWTPFQQLPVIFSMIPFLLIPIEVVRQLLQFRRNR